MALRRFIALTCLTLSTLAFGQQPPEKQPFPWTVLTDPACPVPNYYGTQAPNATKELRVLYFPQGRASKLKDPQSLALRIGYNYPGSNASMVPLTRKDDHWEATIALEPIRAMYAIFYVTDVKTGAIDDNGGQLWDVKFCSAQGGRDPSNILRDAQSYTGVNWGGLRRPKDYNKAVSILEVGMAQTPNIQYWFNDLWAYKAQRDGDDTQAWTKLSKELSQYLAEHPNDPAASMVVGSFVVSHQDKLPAEFVDQTVDALDAAPADKKTGRKHSYRSDLEYLRAIREQDVHKRLAAIDSFIAKYPDTPQIAFAYEVRFYTLVDLGDVAGAEGSFAKYREMLSKDKNYNDPNSYNADLALVRMYLDKRTKLDMALSLIDQARESANRATNPGQRLPDWFVKSLDAQCAELRARVYVAMKKPDLALPQARKSLELNPKNPDAHFVLAQALAATGDKQKALDEYFEAALMPSNKDLEYGSELQKFYLDKKFGNLDQFNAELQKRKTARFLASKYTPATVDKPAPAFEFASLKGEKFDAASHAQKCVVINFWSPG